MVKSMIVAGAVVVTVAAVYAQHVPTATCKGCPASYISNEELQAYLQRAVARNQIDQQVRAVDIVKSGVAVGMVQGAFSGRVYGGGAGELGRVLQPAGVPDRGAADEVKDSPATY